MSNHRWSKFWWQDWQGDKCLRRCSIGARGLWMEMLCIAHECEPYGHLRLNGQPLNAADLADMIATVSLKDVVRLLAELEGKGVFSRADDGTIYCRRMVRDGERSDEGRDNSAKRWGHKPNGAPNGGGNGHPTRQPNGEANGDPIGNPNPLEAEADSDPEAEGTEEEFFRNLPLAAVPAGAGASPAPSGADIWAGEASDNDDDTPSQAEILSRRERFHDELSGAERTPTMVGRIAQSTRSSATRAEGVKPYRSAVEQLNAIQPQPRPTAYHLTPEQLAEARGRTRLLVSA